MRGRMAKDSTLTILSDLNPTRRHDAPSCAMRPQPHQMVSGTRPVLREGTMSSSMRRRNHAAPDISHVVSNRQIAGNLFLRFIWILQVNGGWGLLATPVHGPLLPPLWRSRPERFVWLEHLPTERRLFANRGIYLIQPPPTYSVGVWKTIRER